jgi:hypothetical protein
MTNTTPLDPLTLLPKEEWLIHPLNERKFAVSIFARNGTHNWQKWSVFDFPNDFFGIEDLERAGLLGVYMAAISKLREGAPAEPLGRST